MRFLNFIFGSTKASTVVETKADTPLSDPWAALAPLSQTTAGPSVGPATALRVPAVASAVALIAGATGSLPVKIYRSVNGAREAADDHPAYRLLHKFANDWTSAGQFRAKLTFDALLNEKGGFAYVNSVNGRPVELLRLDPASMSVDYDKISGEPVYSQGTGRGRRTFHYTEILHLQAPDGIAPIVLAKEAIGLALVLEQHGARLFANGARPSGILKFTKTLGEEAIKRIMNGWRAAHGGTNSGGTAILEEGGEFQPLAFTSVDAQFAEMRAFQILEIARAFRVPPPLLFDLSRATWSNSEEMNRSFLTYTLRPWLDQWEAAYTRALIPVEDRADLYVEFVTDALLSADTAKRAAAYAQLRAAGVLTANEIRAKENLPPHPEGNTLASPYTLPASADQSALTGENEPRRADNDDREAA